MGKPSKAKSANNKLFLCAYYHLKSTGYFVDSGKNFPSHKEILSVLSRLSGLPDNTGIEVLLDALSIPHHRGILESYRKLSSRKFVYIPPAHKTTTEYIPSEIFFSSKEWLSLRYRVLETNNATCQCCGRSRKRHGVVLHVDHIKPRSIFPSLSLDINNLQVLCEDCNLGKSNKYCTDWR